METAPFFIYFLIFYPFSPTLPTTEKGPDGVGKRKIIHVTKFCNNLLLCTKQLILCP